MKEHLELSDYVFTHTLYLTLFRRYLISKFAHVRHENYIFSIFHISRICYYAKPKPIFLIHVS